MKKILPSAHVDDGICDCCDGSDESTVSCPNTCREMGEKTRQLHREKIAETKQALKTRSEYEATAAAEIPTKRLRIEELEKQMKEEDAILEAVNLKKQGMSRSRAWRYVLVRVFIVLCARFLLSEFRQGSLWPLALLLAAGYSLLLLIFAYFVFCRRWSVVFCFASL